MAVSFTSLTSNTYYTSDLQTIGVSATTVQVEFRIYYQARIYYSGDGRELIFRSTYYPQNNTLTIYDVADIIENFMRERTQSVEKFVLFLSGNSDSIEQEITCIYCKQRLLQPTAADLLNDYFLTTHASRLVPTNAEIRLSFYIPTGSAGGYATVGTTYTITYIQANGEAAQAQRTNYTRMGYGVQEIFFDYSYLQTMFSNYISSDAVIASVLVKTGNRLCRIYFTQRNDLHKFWFHNAFNCLDFVYLATTRVVKTETKSSIANLCTHKAQYDVQHTRSYEETTSQLTKDEAVWLSEMLTSHYIAVEDDGDEEEILITDYKAETTDEQGEGNTIEFTWQYASVRYMLGKDEFSRIFTKEYKEPFA